MVPSGTNPYNILFTLFVENCVILRKATENGSFLKNLLTDNETENDIDSE